MYSVERTHAMVALGILSTAFGPVERTSSAPYTGRYVASCTYLGWWRGSWA
jgi:hypothetical protein